MQTAKEKILRHIRSHGGSFAFSPKDFQGLASRGAIDVALSALTADGVIRRIGRGLYDYPRKAAILGELMPPDMDQAAQAIARKHRWTISPDGATAANMLGLSQQVPAKIVYLSDGPSRKLKIGQQPILFRHASPKDLRMDSYSSRLIAQALRYLGKEGIDDKVLDRLRRIVPQKDRAKFLKDARYGTDWILEVALKVAQEDGNG